jgi:hypothetical protein
MKKIYLTPAIRIQAIDTQDILDNSIPIFDANNPKTDPNVTITDGSEVLGNGTSIWDIEEE